MIHADSKFSDLVERAVARLEEQTDAEVVIVSAERSGHYRDLAAMVATTASILLLVVLLALPAEINPLVAIFDMFLIWALTAWLANARWAIRRIASASRRDAQVRRSAAAEFHLEAVHATPSRTGLLIYLSALEARVELIPDVGLEARIPRGMWAQAATEFAHDDLDHFLAGLDKVGKVLAEHVPATEEGKLVDLPNAPRIR